MHIVTLDALSHQEGRQVAGGSNISTVDAGLAIIFHDKAHDSLGNPVFAGITGNAYRDIDCKCPHTGTSIEPHSSRLGSVPCSASAPQSSHPFTTHAYVQSQIQPWVLDHQSSNTHRDQTRSSPHSRRGRSSSCSNDSCISRGALRCRSRILADRRLTLGHCHRGARH